jgi:quinol-cytochrome oxidoreductase complex cytochrome b subunit
MIVLVRKDAPPDAVEQLREAVRGLGLDIMPLDDRKGSAFEVVGADRGRVLGLRHLDAVEEVLTRRRRLTGGEPLWPHFALRLAILVTLLFLVLGVLTAFFPPGLGDRALSEGAPVPQQVEWPLRPLEGFLDLVPGAGWIFLLGWIAFMFWPFLDRSDRSTPRGRRLARLLRWLGVTVMAFLVALAFRGLP